MRSDAPLIEKLMTDKEQPSYAVALEESGRSRRWASALAGLPSLVFLLGMLDAVKFTR